MAQRLEVFNRPQKLTASSVPWDEWIQEDAIWKVTEGIDFTTKAKGFQAQISKKAKDRGFKAEQYTETETDVDGSVVTHIIFRIVKPKPGESLLPRKRKPNALKGSIFDA